MRVLTAYLLVPERCGVAKVLFVEGFWQIRDRHLREHLHIRSWGSHARPLSHFETQRVNIVYLLSSVNNHEACQGLFAMPEWQTTMRPGCDRLGMSTVHSEKFVLFGP